MVEGGGMVGRECHLEVHRLFIGREHGCEPHSFTYIIWTIRAAVQMFFGGGTRLHDVDSLALFSNCWLLWGGGLLREQLSSISRQSKLQFAVYDGL